jgi:hypothetical protein
MEMALRVISVLGGLFLVLLAVSSAIRTVILPRAAPSFVTRVVFRGLGVLFRSLAPASGDYARRDRVMSLYAPLGLVGTLAAWLLLTFAGFGFIFWGLEVGVGVTEALELSGSSLFTLGFLRPETFWVLMVSYIEAAIGLFLLALLITYLPSMYGAFSRREVAVTALSVRAGEPPSGREMIWRYWRLERMDHLREVWREWERWFVDVEETHTSLPALVFFRSPLPDHSWATAAGAVLDGAALTLSTVNVPRDVEAEFCIRAGYLCLRRVADYFRIPHDPDPTPETPISITRAEWEEAVAFLEGEGVPIKADRERAWRDFAGWRVNYDTVLLALANLTIAPEAPWSSDRSQDQGFRLRRMGGIKPAKHPLVKQPPRSGRA